MDKLIPRLPLTYSPLIASVSIAIFREITLRIQKWYNLCTLQNLHVFVIQSVSG
jgi:hypothetical protein